MYPVRGADRPARPDCTYILPDGSGNCQHFSLSELNKCVDFSAFDGNQYFEVHVPIPEPSQHLLVASFLGVAGLIRSDRRLPPV